MNILKVAITLVTLLNYSVRNFVGGTSLTTVECGVDSIKINVPHDVQPLGFVDANVSLILGDSEVCDTAGAVDSECQGVSDGLDGYNFTITNFTKCQPIVSSENNHSMSIAFKVARYPTGVSGVIRRVRCGFFYVQCNYYYNRTLNMTNSIDMNALQPVESINANLTANNSYTVDLSFTTGDYLTDETCLVLNLGDMIYVRARVTPSGVGAADDYAVSVTNCYATPDGQLNSSYKYQIIDEEGCVELVDNESYDDKGITSEGEEAQAEFYFKSFIWRESGKNQIYVHCDVIVCPKLLGACIEGLPTVDSCTANKFGVSSRFRRSTKQNEHRFKKSVVSSPISISKLTDSVDWTQKLKVQTKTEL